MNAVAGKNVVVTGAIPGHSRATAEAALCNLGARVQSAVSKTTDVLVTGAKVGPKKLEKAAQFGVLVLSWENAVSGCSNGAAVDDEPFDGYSRNVAAGLPPDGDVGEVVQYVGARVIAPQLAKKGELPIGPAWLYEIKWDGYRCIATVSAGQVAMQSRSAKSEYVEQFPAIAKELDTLPDCVLDGELVVLDDKGNSSFESMDAKTGASYVVFDALSIGGQDLRSMPLETRRALLADFLSGRGLERITLSPAFDDGEQLLAWADEQKVEGIVAKLRRSAYLEGKRDASWTKVKLRQEQEFAVLGWIPGEGEMEGAAGSLVLATIEDDVWTYAGRVGTGQVDYAWWKAVSDRPLREVPRIDVDLPATVARSVEWLAAPFVVQVQFQRWTEDGKLWHPSVLGIRTDKTPEQCRRES